MSTMIDTLALAKRLRAAAGSDNYADELAEAIGNAVNERAVTKADLGALADQTKADFGLLKADFKALSDQTKADFGLLKADFKALSDQTKADFGLLEADFKALSDQTKADFGLLKADFKALSDQTKADGTLMRAELTANMSKGLLNLFFGLTGVIGVATALILHR